MPHKRLAVLVVPLVAAGVVAVPALAATKTVQLKDDFFSPKALSISQGTTLKWVWKGKAPHNVTVTAGPVKFRSAIQTSGTYTHKFTKAGKYTIVCTIHPQMISKVTVK
jgi:plastocyanin